MKRYSYIVNSSESCQKTVPDKNGVGEVEQGEKMISLLQSGSSFFTSLKQKHPIIFELNIQKKDYFSNLIQSASLTINQNFTILKESRQIKEQSYNFTRSILTLSNIRLWTGQVKVCQILFLKISSEENDTHKREKMAFVQ